LPKRPEAFFIPAPRLFLLRSITYSHGLQIRAVRNFDFYIENRSLSPVVSLPNHVEVAFMGLKSAFLRFVPIPSDKENLLGGFHTALAIHASEKTAIAAPSIPAERSLPG
jgi:hypothetical protein